MKHPLLRLTQILGITFGLVLAGILPAQATEAQLNFISEPLRYAAVTGDVGKFQEQHWIKEGYDAGIESFSLDAQNLPADVKASLFVHSMVRSNDHEVKADLTKEDLGYVRLRYQEFSKYYDDTGAVYDPFFALASNSLDRQLELEIGHFSVEVGLTLPDLPEISFYYERRYKNGDKSRITLTTVSEGGVSKDIGPTWQEVDEMINIFAVRIAGEVVGFQYHAEQKWEFEDSHYLREEASLSNTNTASSYKVRRQVQDPQARTVQTTLKLEKWDRDDTVFTGTAYRYVHLSSQEMENIYELNGAGGITNFNFPKQIRNAVSDSDYDAHTWVANAMITPHPTLTVTGKFKSEIVRRHGTSVYPEDTTPAAGGGASPDGIINITEESSTNNRLRQFGEAISMHYTGIPHTAVYTEFEFEQINNWLSEDRDSKPGQSAPSANEIFGRETITNSSRGTGTIGARFSSGRMVDATTHFRYRRGYNDYEDRRETAPGGSTARSAFVDSLSITLREVAVRITFKPKRWLRTSFRYKFQGYDYQTSVENLNAVETDFNAHIFAYDISVQPIKRLMLMSSVVHQQAWVSTPASSSTTTARAPRFNMDYTSWFLNGEYQACDHVSMNGSLMLTLASNFDDFDETGLPLGADYVQFDMGFGLKILLPGNVTLEPRYDFYTYQPNAETDSSDYHAHLMTVKGSVAWG